MEVPSTKSSEATASTLISEQVPDFLKIVQKSRKAYSSFEMFKKNTHFETTNLLRDIPSHLQGKRITGLTYKLEESMNFASSLPIEYLESKLFDLSRSYFLSLNSSNLITKNFIEMHPLLKLIEEDSAFFDNARQLMTQNLSINKSAIKEYNFIKLFIKFINDLILVWGVSNLYNYRFRFSHRLELIYFINLDDIFSDLVTCEMIWLSYAVKVPPLSYIVSGKVIKKGEILLKTFEQIVDLFMKSNENYVQSYESIESWLSYKNPILNRNFNFAMPSKVVKPRYQRLQDSFCDVFCRKKQSNLKFHIKSFENAYRNFEEAILSALVEMSNSCFK
ncbi:hypothetical protein SteCoe_25207 [Stentor coeruleus]|uniref:Uncharacterized protein n=1 Tax=Stentor coeruleus TaxID=5963 RepID=A0A1R2BFR8_9CILI|nr:hypothetical protein SteCoe_25207 [Stentor coeruleus]